MAYASKYYDPVKAHEYYMRTRQLKGYENRYGGHRGNGTSAASQNNKKSSSQTATKNHNANVKSNIQNLQKQISSIRSSSASSADKRAQIQSLRDRIQRERQSIKGGSTSGFNQKGREAAEYIKKSMNEERNAAIKKSNKAVDSEMLSEARRLHADIQAMRRSGRGFSRAQYRNRLTKLTRMAKKRKRAKFKENTSIYKQKYKDEIDRLRSDDSMFSYYDRKNKKNKKSKKRR